MFHSFLSGYHLDAGSKEICVIRFPARTEIFNELAWVGKYKFAWGLCIYDIVAIGSSPASANVYSGLVSRLQLPISDVLMIRPHGVVRLEC